MKYGKIFNPETNEIVDEVLVSYFKEPKVILKKICAKLIHMVELLWLENIRIMSKNGAQMAEPGEFTKRAFWMEE